MNLTKSPKHDHIYKLHLHMLEERKCLILTSLYLPKLKNSNHDQNLLTGPLLRCTESLKHNDIENF